MIKKRRSARLPRILSLLPAILFTHVVAFGIEMYVVEAQAFFAFVPSTLFKPRAEPRTPHFVSS